MKSIRMSAHRIFVFFLCLFYCGIAQGRDLRASLPQLPPLVESAEKGILVDLVKAIDGVYEAGSISIQVFPFARSMRNVSEGVSDFHMPILFNPSVSEDQLDYRHSTETIFNVIFVMYTNESNKEINISNASNYKIETDRAHVQYFDFPVRPSNNIESSLKKVDMGRIDGFIFAMPETDDALKKLGLNNIKRREYKKFEVKMVLPKGERGEEVNRILTAAIKKLHENGEYQKIMAPISNQVFQEWPEIE